MSKEHIASDNGQMEIAENCPIFDNIVFENDFHNDFFIKEDREKDSALVCSCRCWEVFADEEEAQSFLDGLIVCGFARCWNSNESNYVLFKNDEYIERLKKDCCYNDEYYIVEFGKTGPVRGLGIDRHAAESFLVCFCGGWAMTYKNNSSFKDKMKDEP